MTSRRQGREMALQILFQSEFAPQISLEDLLAIKSENMTPDSQTFARELVNGVMKHKSEIDSLIQKNSRHWRLERMATVDRNVLRIAIWELRFSPQPLEKKIVINEAVEIARKYGTTDSSAFVNGILDQVARNP
ncbi:MAG: transcription antitermination factor NusB [Bdellovibrionaceae bacterium]|nr:transcription antitermination factor NusB [Pseudobdellovibrionaceae bacterium]